MTRKVSARLCDSIGSGAGNFANNSLPALTASAACAMQIVSNIVPSAGVVSPGLDVRDIKSMLNGLTQIERPS